MLKIRVLVGTPQHNRLKIKQQDVEGRPPMLAMARCYSHNDVRGKAGKSMTQSNSIQWIKYEKRIGLIWSIFYIILTHFTIFSLNLDKFKRKTLKYPAMFLYSNLTQQFHWAIQIGPFPFEPVQLSSTLWSPNRSAQSILSSLVRGVDGHNYVKRCCMCDGGKGAIKVLIFYFFLKLND